MPELMMQVQAGSKVPRTGGWEGSMPLEFRIPHPGGMADNLLSQVRQKVVSQPSLRDSPSQTSNSTLKRWAIILCPSGTPSGMGQKSPRSARNKYGSSTSPSLQLRE